MGTLQGMAWSSLGSKLLVLGRGGFLGTHPVNGLLQEGASVRVVDRHRVSCANAALGYGSMLGRRREWQWHLRKL